VPRSTKDADFVVDLGDASIARVGRLLPSTIRIDPQMSFETATMTRRFVATVEGSPFRIEFFLLSDDDHDRERFRRRRPSPFLGRTVFLPTAEDVVITKLRWYSVLARAKDRDDARDVLAVQADALDWDYIDSWCDRHGTRALLDEIRRSIPPLD
jgi:hypothetical protein